MILKLRIRSLDSIFSLMEALNFLKNILSSDAGSFGTAVVLFGFILWAAWKVSSALTQIKTEREGVLKSIEKIDERFTKIDERFTKVDERILSIKEDMVVMSGNITLLLSKGGKERAVKSNSPLSLTEKGDSIAEQLNAQVRVTSNWETIRRELDANLVTSNPYDIQQYCLDKIAVAPERFFSAPDLDAMKTIAYQNGDTFFEYCQVLGVIVRDRYLKEKGLDAGEIDKFDPKKQGHRPVS